MSIEIGLRYLHFISLFGIVGAMVSQHLLLKKQLTRIEIHRLSVIDAVYGISAILAVTAGLCLWLAVGKPAEFYSQNWIFLLKVGLAALMGILSLPPTIFFLKNRKGEQRDELVVVPSYIMILLRLELLLLFLIPFCAVLMAKGIGFSAG